MGFPGVDLAKIKASFVGEGEIPAITRNSGRPDGIVGRVGGKPSNAKLRGPGKIVALSQEEPEPDSKKNENYGRDAGDDPPKVEM